MTNWPDAALWPHDPLYHGIDGHRMHYVDVGEGAPVLFSHGTPTWSFEWRHAIADLPDARCIAVDHLGFGRSDRPKDVGYRPEDHAARFSAFADTLDLRDVTLVLHDYGGPIALPWAIANPDRIRRIVLVNTFAWPLDDDAGVARPARLLGGWFGRVLYRWANLSLRVIMPMAYADRSKLTKAVHAQYLAPFTDRQARVRVLWPLARALLSSSGFYGGLKEQISVLSSVPVTIAWGMQDAAFKPHQLATWQRLLPHAQIERLEHAGHWPHEEQPEVFAQILREAVCGERAETAA